MLDEPIPTPEEQKENYEPPNYLLVFLALALLTALEVGVTYLNVPRVPILVPLAIIKAGLVVAFYMHLKTDKKVFRFVFIAGVIMGALLLISFLALFLPQMVNH